MACDLTRLLKPLAASAVIGERHAHVTHVTADSRSVRPGTLFVALRGERVDGHDFIDAATRAGATVIVAETARPVPHGVTLVVVPETRAAASRIAAAFYGEPSRAMHVAGITGTNGKTTVAHLIAAVFASAGLPCATVGTLGVHFGALESPGANTTPPALELHAVLADLRARGARAVAMEVSSHALALGRVDDVAFAAGVFTNLTRDHLDFHHTLEAYAAAKRRLFDLAPRAVLDLDDPYGAQWAQELRARGTPVVDYALDRPAALRAESLELLPDGSRFTVAGVEVRIALPGRFNVANALAALGLARALDLPFAEAARALGDVARVDGRMERFGHAGVAAIVDYAHTPDALANVLRAARETTRGRLIAVFGCGGDRDPGKRPQMGAVARELADIVIVTSDNPRSEDPGAIARAIAGPHDDIVLDRATAIAQAIERARPGDTVVVAGKGHETYQIVGAERRHFDDREVVRRELARLGGTR